MPCMCGDIRCFSCGPAQGNNRCPICRKWDDEGGCVDPLACAKALEGEARMEAFERLGRSLSERCDEDDVMDYHNGYAVPFAESLRNPAYDGPMGIFEDFGEEK